MPGISDSSTAVAFFRLSCSSSWRGAFLSVTWIQLLERTICQPPLASWKQCLSHPCFPWWLFLSLALPVVDGFLHIDFSKPRQYHTSPTDRTCFSKTVYSSLLGKMSCQALFRELHLGSQPRCFCRKWTQPAFSCR